MEKCLCLKKNIYKRGLMNLYSLQKLKSNAIEQDQTFHIMKMINQSQSQNFNQNHIIFFING